LKASCVERVRAQIAGSFFSVVAAAVTDLRFHRIDTSRVSPHARPGLVDAGKFNGGITAEQQRNHADDDAADRKHAVIFARNGIHGV
jgi:hypothetical protein